MNIAYPFAINGRGRTATAGDADHIRDLIEQLLFTSPGERVNRPDLGSGLMQMVYTPNSPELAATLQFTLQAALQRWLRGDLIAGRKQHAQLDVSSVDSELRCDHRHVRSAPHGDDRQAAPARESSKPGLLLQGPRRS